MTWRIMTVIIPCRPDIIHQLHNQYYTNTRDSDYLTITTLIFTFTYKSSANGWFAIQRGLESAILRSLAIYKVYLAVNLAFLMHIKTPSCNSKNASIIRELKNVSQLICPTLTQTDQFRHLQGHHHELLTLLTSQPRLPQQLWILA